jgi:hypothetical protein
MIDMKGDELKSTLLTENQAQNLIIELHDFIERPKYRGKPKSEE